MNTNTPAQAHSPRSLHQLGVMCGLAAGAWLGAAEAPTIDRATVTIATNERRAERGTRTSGSFAPTSTARASPPIG